jgi:hypothetical protein
VSIVDGGESSLNQLIDSHMVCEGGRPCERWLFISMCSENSKKRDIAHLCRDVTPPPNSKDTDDVPAPVIQPPFQFDTIIPPIPPAIPQIQTKTQLPPSLYSDPNFPPAWPLLSDTPGNNTTYVDGTVSDGMSRDPSFAGNSWGLDDETELGALSYIHETKLRNSKFLGDLGVPSLPGGFLDVLSYFGKGGGGNNMAGVPIPGVTDMEDDQIIKIEPSDFVNSGETSQKMSRGVSDSGIDKSDKGKGKDTPTSTAPPIVGSSRL